MSATQTFAVGVSDRLVREVVGETLAAMARGHLASARMTLGRRLAAGGDARSRLTVRGRPVPLGKAEARAALAQLAAGWQAGLRHGPHPVPGGSLWGHGMPGVGTGGAPGLGAAPGGMRLGGFGGGMTPGGMTPGSLGPGGLLGGFGGGSDGMLRGTEFVLALSPSPSPSPSSGDGATQAGPRWQVWGQGDVQMFQGTPSAASVYDGRLWTDYVGVDRQLTDRWRAGVARARSGAVGDWRVGGARGRLTATLTALHPYVQWSDDATSVSATGGVGWGEADNVRDADARAGTSPLGLRLGLVEARRRVGAPGGGLRLAVRGDAAWAQLRTGRGGESVDAQTAAVHQVRLGTEVSRPVRAAGGLTLVPSVEAHARRDRGAGPTGDGVEFVAGLRAVRGMVRVDAQARLLALHSASGYRERGAGVTLSVGDHSREGLSLSLTPRWGERAAGGALWQEQVYRRHLPAAAGDEWALDARGEYGMRAPGGGLLSWFGSYSQSPYGRRFLLGGRLGLLGGATPAGW